MITKFGSSKMAAAGIDDKGFSLLELMVVVAIVAILAFYLVLTPRPAIIDVKKAVFNLSADLGFARSEAVRRNQPVIVYLDADVSSGATNNNYTLCVVDPAAIDGDCDDATDEKIKTVQWDPKYGVEFYDDGVDDGTPGAAINAPAGPNIEACDDVGTCDETAVDFWPDPDGGDKDGVRTDSGNNYIVMMTDGSCDTNGEIYVYHPDPADGGNILKTPPIALIVSQSGVVQNRRWIPGTGWDSK